MQHPPPKKKKITRPAVSQIVCTTCCFPNSLHNIMFLTNHSCTSTVPTTQRFFFFFFFCLSLAGFIFPHKVTHFLEESLSDELIKSYRDDLDFQNLIDLVQQEFECCGISSQGFK